MRVNKLLIGGLAVTALLVSACNVEQEEEGEMPDVDVEYQEGELPEYEIRKTEEGRMPDVDVDAEGGNLPEYDVEGPDVDIGTEEKTVEVPDVDVDVDTEDETITVPDVDVDIPEDDGEIEEGEDASGSN